MSNVIVRGHIVCAFSNRILWARGGTTSQVRILVKYEPIRFTVATPQESLTDRRRSIKLVWTVIIFPTLIEKIHLGFSQSAPHENWENSAHLTAQRARISRPEAYIVVERGACNHCTSVPADNDISFSVTRYLLRVVTGDSSALWRTTRHPWHEAYRSRYRTRWT